MRPAKLLLYPSLVSLLCLPASADEAPRRKPGLWEIQNESNGRPVSAGPIQTCVGENTDNIIQQGAADMRAQCEKMEARKVGDGYVISSVCKLGQTTASTEGKFTGSFDSAYRGEMHITYSPPIHGMAKADMIVTAKWLSPCKEGQKGGDIVMPAMPGMPKSMNMEDIMRMRDQTKRMQAR